MNEICYRDVRLLELFETGGCTTCRIPRRKGLKAQHSLDIGVTLFDGEISPGVGQPRKLRTTNARTILFDGLPLHMETR